MDEAGVSPLDVSAIAGLRSELEGLDGRGYRAYKALQGRSLFFARARVSFDHIQGDPFADPTRVTARFSPDAADLPASTLDNRDALRAAADYLHRRLYRVLRAAARPIGSGGGGRLRTPAPVAEVLDRTAVRVDAAGSVELRFGVGLPARGRRILGHAAAELLCDRLPEALSTLLPLPAADRDDLVRHVRAIEDAVALRAAVPGLGLVAFVGDGAVLPRRSGVDDGPMDRSRAVPFASPESLRVTISTPHSGPVTGMGVPAGVTLIVGGGFHGKSTLLRALERGVYDHPPGDGRERVVTVPDAVKVRAEDRRRIAGTDIANFLAELPGDASTDAFRTEDASGSTSQAAAIAEAIAVGTSCLLLDEDTSATNLLIRDARMRALVPDDAEPITPYVDRARALYEEEGVSSLLVLGGSGDYFDVADTVLLLHTFRVRDSTAEAHAIADSDSREPMEPRTPWRPIRSPRLLPPPGVDPAARVRVPTRSRLLLGRRELDLGGVEQIVAAAQTLAIGGALRALARVPPRDSGLLPDALNALMERVERDGLDILQDRRTGDLAGFRAAELAAAYHRLRP